MQNSSEKEKLEELTSRIFDNNEIITRKSISNLFLMHYCNVEALFTKLLKIHADKGLIKEYLCTGIKDGHHQFLVINYLCLSNFHSIQDLFIILDCNRKRK